MHGKKWIAVLVLSLSAPWALAEQGKQQGKQQTQQMQGKQMQGMQEPGKVVGMVAQQQGNELTVLDTWSQPVQLHISPDAQIMFENQKASMKQLEPGTDVAVNYTVDQGKPSVTSVEIIQPAEQKGIPKEQLQERIQLALQRAQRQQQPGKVVGMVAQQRGNELVVLDTWSERVQLRISPEAKIMFEEQKASMKQLEPGTDVAVSYTIEQGQPTVTSVEIIQPAKQKGIPKQQLQQRIQQSLQRAQQ